MVPAFTVRGQASPWGRGSVLLLTLLFPVWALGLCAAEDAELEHARELLGTGQYRSCAGMAAEAMSGPLPLAEWYILGTRALLALGQREEAQTTVSNALARYETSLRLHVLACEVFRSLGKTHQARGALEAARELVEGRPWALREAGDLVGVGQVALWLGHDPRQVLERVFDVAKRVDPACREVYEASGALALEKHDFELAARTYEEGLGHHPTEAAFHYGLARAYAPSHTRAMLDHLQQALARNTNHVPSLLLLASHLVDAEDYSGAERWLERVRRIDPWEPEAWTLTAVLAHLRHDPKGEQAARAQALRFWPTNPRVDHLLGLNLSRKYRFAEGAACQRRAILLDPDYLPAKAQLASDLLRLGDETEGWRLAADVHEKDGYAVTAFNLLNLRDAMSRYTSLTNEAFVLRMASPEAEVYGSRVLALLGQARDRLALRYGYRPDQAVTVELFPDQRDFGVRTFGLPENPGYLGVCFGRVITATSPTAHPGHPVNWQAVLWHEYTHVVTLQLTRNKMPRWLSEGISVHEERQAHPAWGQSLTPRFRELILKGELSAITNLSAVFLNPPTPEHLPFAYFQASLVVEHLVHSFGLEKLKAVLRDLGDDVDWNLALERHMAPIAKLEAGFAAMARERALGMAPGLDWSKPDRATRPGGATAEGGLSPAETNYWTLMRMASELLEGGRAQAAQEPLQRLVELYPASTGLDSAWALLARAHRELGETNLEYGALHHLAEQDAAAPDAYARLMELAAFQHDWPRVKTNAWRFLAIHPMVSTPYRFLARAGEATGDGDLAIEAYRALLRLNPANPVEPSFQLARLLHARGDPSARRHLLDALEEAPRDAEALRLLLDMNRSHPAAPGPTPQGP